MIKTGKKSPKYLMSNINILSESCTSENDKNFRMRRDSDCVKRRPEQQMAAKDFSSRRNTLDDFAIEKHNFIE